MNKIIIHANRHPNDHRCYDNNHDRSPPTFRLLNTHRKQRIQINVFRNYTGQQLRLREYKESL
ncbi:hypothetical protein [Commensalibacter nepenthis]|uniref:Uncharacterized protein n=1 Tax=Commensalibacter nepenthis TaxID=3043872 RepID=A0ABT6Q9G2_9PROT|nr:hypothetical protein [Commensalibacter sp. TBRC 10068]MDI2113392.1 hypothetical protein [Commensalibacter sp. TBRC 10068]